MYVTQTSIEKLVRVKSRTLIIFVALVASALLVTSFASADQASAASLVPGQLQRFAAGASSDGSYKATSKDPAAKGAITCVGGSSSCPIVKKYVNPLIRLLAALTGILAVVAIIMGGIQIASSAGDPQKAASGRKHIRDAVIGILAFIFLYAFLNWLIPGGI